MTEEAERCEQRALWCDSQAEKWRLKGLDGLAEAYRQRAEDWKAEAARWRKRKPEEGTQEALKALYELAATPGRGEVNLRSTQR